LALLPAAQDSLFWSLNINISFMSPI
jgi:hypothetical protein